MGRKPKHAGTTPSDVLDLPDHRIAGPMYGPRKYDPEAGQHSWLVDLASGDWSWKPLRNKQFAQNGMPAYRPARHPLQGIRF